MPDRVLLDDAGLRVSKPGYDVKTATEGQLLFNSRWSAMKRLLFGQFDIAVPGPGDFPTNHTVMYGKTFTYRPLVFSIVHGYNNSVGLNGGIPRHHIGTAAYFVFYSPSPNIRYVVNVRNDRFNVQMNSSFSENGVWTRARVYYAIWDHGLG
ncbi:hypothetical protein JF546_02400 [Nitratireductor aquimarinus]|uniref:hypothetical protein n=1 Tax=Nitratireductor aquimarinus TaxID=889300 RepID=UPI001A8C5245|nr:hypothetical protein [Nitratireductor aquimarinus]MBN8241859.1 hypothetical protein [Nitratireductor aquimarinus]MBY6130245.1 hypothetical protein [Nitratireductor aquimarinus]MCA1305126.1 hypothetical protein [Nitratireductor aquimarinus]